MNLGANFMRIMILGASGMIGHRIWLEAKERWQNNVFCTMRNPVNSDLFRGKNIYSNIDVQDWLRVVDILNREKPDVIINAVGITIRKSEIDNLNNTIEINSFFPRRLLKWAQANNSRVIHLSTDCVFDGGEGQYTELSQPTAKDNYGKTKFLGEIEGEKALTLRFSCIGRELNSHTELLDWFLSQNGKTIRGFSHVMYSGLTSTVIAKEICRLINDFPNLEGVFQLSSDPISKYDLLCLAKEYFKVDVEIEKFENFSSDKTLVCDKYKSATGFKPASWRDMMKEISLDPRVAYNEF